MVVISFSTLYWMVNIHLSLEIRFSGVLYCWKMFCSLCLDQKHMQMLCDDVNPLALAVFQLFTETFVESSLYWTWTAIHNVQISCLKNLGQFSNAELSRTVCHSFSKSVVLRWYRFSFESMQAVAVLFSQHADSCRGLDFTSCGYFQNCTLNCMHIVTELSCHRNIIKA